MRRIVVLKENGSRRKETKEGRRLENAYSRVKKVLEIEIEEPK